MKVESGIVDALCSACPGVQENFTAERRESMQWRLETSGDQPFEVRSRRLRFVQMETLRIVPCGEFPDFLDRQARHLELEFEPFIKVLETFS